ncbi:BQ2448_5546 [Microbotryum intermedium]|uniref:Transcription initiation factor IIA subunit 2 n=1 Tax=Microbotryum intermedium TaxID=269621 RepID=A0A238EYD7_9BASI|nr:BQ2448_5546 [Microbotryum intermedium]
MSSSKAGSGSVGTTAQNPFYQAYRRSSLGLALMESLDELIQSGHLSPQLALKLLAQFDKSATLAFSSHLKTKATIRSPLKVYNHVEDVWTFTLDRPTFKLENNAETIFGKGKCKIVALKAGSADLKA